MEEDETKGAKQDIFFYLILASSPDGSLFVLQERDRNRTIVI